MQAFPDVDIAQEVSYGCCDGLKTKLTFSSSPTAFCAPQWAHGWPSHLVSYISKMGRGKWCSEGCSGTLSPCLPFFSPCLHSAQLLGGGVSLWGAVTVAPQILWSIVWEQAERKGLEQLSGWWQVQPHQKWEREAIPFFPWLDSHCILTMQRLCCWSLHPYRTYF